MLMRFDLNRDGKVDMQEWELARTQARREVEQQHLMKAHHGSFTLAKPADGKLYLISALSPQILRNHYQYWSLAHLVLLVVLLMAYVTLT
jgi:predicted Zn-dependent peptidase